MGMSSTNETPADESPCATTAESPEREVKEVPSDANPEIGLDIPSDATSSEDDEKPPPRRTQKDGSMHVLFLSSDTGGGHRASAEALAKQFQILFPGTTYDLLDVVEKDGVAPYNSLVSSYKHLSAHPSQWKLVYTVSNSRAFEMLADAHLKLMCERAVRRRIQSYDPDVVVSVHPLMTNVPVLSCSKISHATKRHLPMFTVVTDLGSAHCLWFANGVEKMFVGSDQIQRLARERGKVPPEKLVQLGLPIRHDFAVQSERLGNRHSEEGRMYQQSIRRELGLPHDDRKTILVMGGGEGVGSLSNIVNALYVELVSQGINALVLVVCGRNEKLKGDLETRDWQQVYDGRFTGPAATSRRGITKLINLSFADTCGEGLTTTTGCIESRGNVTSSIRRILSSGGLRNAMTAPLPTTLESTTTSLPPAAAPDTDVVVPTEITEPTQIEQQLVIDEKKLDDAEKSTGIQPDVDIEIDIQEQQVEPSNSLQQEEEEFETKAMGSVTVVGLGFVTQMAEYMIAADILVTKAGPGTISEAAAVALPVMLTSFLPGQEEGNVDFVIDGGFGAYVADTDPTGIAEEICLWLQDADRLKMLSDAAQRKGAPHAARDIAQQIGDSTLKWKELNEERSQSS